MEQKIAPRRGRPREFDLDKTIASAQAVFWKHGLEATSLNQIAHATRLHKPSLYAAFGDKMALYVAALDAYVVLARKLIRKAFSQPTLRQSLRAFFKADLDLFLAEGNRGCFLLSTAVPVAGMHPEVAKRVGMSRASLEGAIRARLEKAKQEDDIRRDIPLETLVQMLTSMHIAIALRARAGERRRELQSTVNVAIDLACGDRS